MSENGIKLELGQLRDVLREYMDYTKRDLATVLNTMAFYISRGAVNNTHRVEAITIRTQLEALLRPEGAETFSKSQSRKVKRFISGGLTQVDVPLVALLINAERGRKGQKGLQGQDMSEASRKFIGRRVSSSAYIASGFIPAIKVFEPLAEKKGQAQPMAREVKARNQRGYGTAAHQGVVVEAIISNLAQSLDDPSGKALELYGTRGLQLAVNDEVKSKQKYIEEKLQETADKFNAR